MKRGHRRDIVINAALAGLLLVALNPAEAQHPSGKPAAPEAAPTDDGGEVKTLKERLSDKASDEQRVDNCNVAPDRRGARPRPDCATSRAPAAAAEVGPASAR